MSSLIATKPTESSESSSSVEHSRQFPNENASSLPETPNTVASFDIEADAVVNEKPQEDSLESNEDPTEVDESSHEDDTPDTTTRYIKYGVGLFLLAFVSFVIADSLTNQFIKTGIEDFLEWMEGHPVGGLFCFILLLCLTTMLFVPGALMTFGAGYVFGQAFGLGIGVALGCFAVFVGACSGAIISFLLGRFLLRDCVNGLTKKFTIMQALDTALDEKGLQILCLLRLSPLMYVSPYLNYGMGGSAVSFSAYTWSLLAVLPTVVMYVFLGASTESLAGGGEDGESSTVTTVALVVGIVLSLVAVVMTSIYAKRELDRIAAATAAEDENNGAEELQEVQQSSDNDNENQAFLH